MISIVLPTFNRAFIIKTAINSILNQSFKDFELIIVDDGSTDDTEKIINDIKDSRIVYTKTNHKGANFARNTGIKMANYNFIAFQDSDDEWFEDKLLTQVEKIRSLPSYYAGVFCNFYRLNSKNKMSVFPDFKPDEENLYYQLLKANFIGTPSLILKKDILMELGSFDDNLPRFQDWELVLRVAEKYKLKHIDKPLFVANNNNDNISKSVDAGYIATKEIYNKHYDVIEKNPRLSSEFSYVLGSYKLKLGDRKNARIFFAKSIKKKLFGWKSWLKYLLTFNFLRNHFRDN